MAFKVALLVLSIIALSAQSPVPENPPLTKLPVGDSSEKKPENKPPVLPTPISIPLNNANASVSASSYSTLKTFNNGQPQVKTQADHAAEANLKLTINDGNARPHNPNSPTDLKSPVSSSGSSTTLRPSHQYHSSNNNRYNPSQQTGRITKREIEDDSEGFAPQDREDSPFGDVVSFDSRNRRIKVLPAFLG